MSDIKLTPAGQAMHELFSTFASQPEEVQHAMMDAVHFVCNQQYGEYDCIRQHPIIVPHVSYVDNWTSGHMIAELFEGNEDPLDKPVGGEF